MRLFALLPLLGLLLGGCAGYHVGPIKPTRMANINSLAITNFRNDTLTPRVEVLLADSLIKQIQQDGTFKIARDHEGDAVVQGRLEEVIRTPVRSVRGNVFLTREFLLTLRCSYTVTNRSTGELIDRQIVTGQTTFFVGGTSPIAADINQDERQAFPLAAENLAVKITSHLSEGW